MLFNFLAKDLINKYGGNIVYQDDPLDPLSQITITAFVDYDYRSYLKDSNDAKQIIAIAVFVKNDINVDNDDIFFVNGKQYAVYDKTEYFENNNKTHTELILSLKLPTSGNGANDDVITIYPNKQNKFNMCETDLLNDIVPTTQFEIMANIKTIKGSDVYNGSNLVGYTTHKFTIDYLPIVDTETIIKYNNKYYEVQYITNVDEMNKKLILECNERGDINTKGNLL